MTQAAPKVRALSQNESHEVFLELCAVSTSGHRPVDDWGKLLGDSAAVTAMLDRLLHHGHVLKCGPRSWRTKTDLPPQEAAA